MANPLFLQASAQMRSVGVILVVLGGLQLFHAEIWIQPASVAPWYSRAIDVQLTDDPYDVSERLLGGGASARLQRTLINVQLESLLEAFLERSPHLRELLFKDHGTKLMNLDGRISEWVHRLFSDQGVPALSVHDSYLIDCTRVSELKRVMAVANDFLARKLKSWTGK
ncbi:hypothetical protein [Parasedimentitalea psychrophila]|uniref:DNA-directed RNA polymerase n=1 Tax=Parasedimentitalea psychrophila TaxID=2997337 RepID=A0A9Y2P3K3_9RHOB|nr:hypothetical protein [Parasedimentitalea psychrophila]WIY26117.1 hypothetical protein QPJ95_04085 [Parasedimentitalea psychrophila]